jgi:polyhydroxyalkanoate synthesis regulator phasin
MEPGRKTVDDLIKEIRFQIQTYYWNENIVSRLSAMQRVVHLAEVAVKELEDEHII